MGNKKIEIKMDKKFTAGFVIFLLIVFGILFVFKNIEYVSNTKKENAYSECLKNFRETVNYAKNNNPSFKSCIDRGATVETGAITDTKLALYCAEKIKDFELLRLLEKVYC